MGCLRMSERVKTAAKRVRHENRGKKSGTIAGDVIRINIDVKKRKQQGPPPLKEAIVMNYSMLGERCC